MKSLSCCVQIFIVIVFIVVTSISLENIRLHKFTFWNFEADIYFVMYSLLIPLIQFFFNFVFILSRMAVLKIVLFDKSWIHTLWYNGAPSFLGFFLTFGSSLLSKVTKWPEIICSYYSDIINVNKWFWYLLLGGYVIECRSSLGVTFKSIYFHLEA